jgi:hypothetical protein
MQNNNRSLIEPPIRQKARIKAFRVPTQFAIEQIINYQGNETHFKNFGYAGTEIPDGWKIWASGVWSEYIRGEGIFCVIEHPSFPEHELGSGPIPLIDFIVGEMEVSRIKSQDDPPKLDFDQWKDSVGMSTYPDSPALKALYQEYLQGQNI